MTSGLSIIIVTYNSWPYIGDCLGSIYDHPPMDVDLEVIVIDNASNDDTVMRVRGDFPSVKVICSPTNVGYGIAANQAVKSSSGDYVMLLNPDCQVTAGAIGTMLRFLASSANAGIVGPRLVLPNGQPQPSGRRFPGAFRVILEVLRVHRLLPARRRADLLLGSYWDQSETRQVEWVSGACHIFRRTVWSKVGELTEKTFCGFDDFDYCFRAAGHGLETWLCADAIVIHHVGTSVSTRWSPSEVDELAINNMYVLLQDLWPKWRVKMLAVAEAAGAVSDCVTAAARPIRSPLDARTERVRRAMRKARLLVGFVSGRSSPLPRCEPGAGRG